MSSWVGYAVSVNCGETLGCYQGTILQTDGSTITLTKAFRNGFPYPKSQVTLNATDIKELRIIEAKSQRAETHSTVGAPRKARATVCETLQANPTNTGNQSASTTNNNVTTTNNVTTNNKTPNPGQRTLPLPSAGAAARSKPVDILNCRKNNNHAGSYGSGSTPTRRGGGGGGGFGGRGEAAGGGGADRARRRNEACFGSAASPALDDDFDFEGNLALFDKRAVWASMRNSKPDVVRTADESKYRHDENILGGGGGGAGGRIVVPDELRGPVDYVTDEGVTVPSVTPALRRQLWEGLQRHGLVEFALAMVARAACDVALRLVGGTRRLEARNAHQAPLVVCLAGAHRGGACGLAAARLLRSRGARVAVHVSGTAEEAVRRELGALALDGVPPPAPSPRDLPPAPDLLLVALYDPLEDNDLDQYHEVCAWARGCRAGAVCVEPAGGGWGAVAARAAVLGVAAVSLPAALGRLYLADAAVPHALYAQHGLLYRPPMAAAPALPLHPML